jgi:hypothetical protein
MSKSFWSIGLAIAIAALAMCWTAVAQQPAPSASYGAGNPGGELITYFLPVEGQPSTLTVIDPAARRMAVYHINRESGEIELKSARNIAWDLQMDYHNNAGILPEEIRKGMERTQ